MSKRPIHPDEFDALLLAMALAICVYVLLHVFAPERILTDPLPDATVEIPESGG